MEPARSDHSHVQLDDGSTVSAETARSLGLAAVSEPEAGGTPPRPATQRHQVGPVLQHELFRWDLSAPRRGAEPTGPGGDAVYAFGTLGAAAYGVLLWLGRDTVALLPLLLVVVPLTFYGALSTSWVHERRVVALRAAYATAAAFVLGALILVVATYVMLQLADGPEATTPQRAQPAPMTDPAADPSDVRP